MEIEKEGVQHWLCFRVFYSKIDHCVAVISTTRKNSAFAVSISWVVVIPKNRSSCQSFRGGPLFIYTVLTYRETYGKFINGYMASATLELEDTTIYAVEVALLPFSVCQCWWSCSRRNVCDTTVNDNNHRLYKLLPATHETTYLLRRARPFNVPCFTTDFIISSCLKANSV